MTFVSNNMWWIRCRLEYCSKFYLLFGICTEKSIIALQDTISENFAANVFSNLEPEKFSVQRSTSACVQYFHLVCIYK